MSRFLSAPRSGAALALCFWAGSAWADAEPSAAALASARTLFNEVRASEERGDWGDALIKIEAVAKVKITPQVRFHLGLCQEHTSHWVEALNNFERAASEGAEQKLPLVIEEANEHAANVRARLPKLLFVLPNVKETRVEVDGQAVAVDLLARPVAFDPGLHHVVARAPGVHFSDDVSLTEREEKRVEIVFAADSSGPSPPAPAPEAVVVGTTTDIGSNDGKARTWGWTAVGVGGALLAGASVSAIVRQGAVNEIESECPLHRDCSRSLESSQTKARTFGTSAVVLGLLGIASAGTGVVLLMQPRHERTTAMVAVAPWITARGAGAAGVVSW